jgi:hypothetical protein
MALAGLEGKGTLRRGRIARRLAEIKRRKEEAKKNIMQVPLSKAIAHMTEGQVDAVVRQFVLGPNAQAIGQSGSAGSANASPQQGSSAVQGGSRRLLQWHDTGAHEGPEGSVVLMQDRPQEKHYGKIQDVVLGKKSPMCLDTRKFEKGITCRAPGLPPPPGYAPATAPSNEPEAPAEEAPPPDTYVAPVPKEIEAPVVCPSYVAPDHGSVWIGAREYRISTASGMRVGAKVKVTCHEHYR